MQQAQETHMQVYLTEIWCAARPRIPAWLGLTVVVLCALPSTLSQETGRAGGMGPPDTSGTTGSIGGTTDTTGNARPLLYLEDILPCDQARCAYLVTVNETSAGPEAQVLNHLSCRECFFFPRNRKALKFALSSSWLVTCARSSRSVHGQRIHKS